jgi:cytochrome c-type protein NapB
MKAFRWLPVLLLVGCATKGPVADPAEAAAVNPRAPLMAERAQRRAFEGAPPVIPHEVDASGSSASCPACHTTGVVVGDKAAPLIPHAEYRSCTQCHTTAAPGLPGGRSPVLANGFEGLSQFGPGARAYEGAPPVVPHPTRMRERCVACHGPQGKEALRTPHPERQSCTQCHPPSARLNQR